MPVGPKLSSPPPLSLPSHAAAKCHEEIREKKLSLKKGPLVVPKPSQPLPHYDIFLHQHPEAVSVGRLLPPRHSAYRTSAPPSTICRKRKDISSQASLETAPSSSRSRICTDILWRHKRHSIIPEPSKLPRALSSSAYKSKNRQTRYASSSKSHAVTTFTSTNGYTIGLLSFYRRHVK